MTIAESTALLTAKQQQLADYRFNMRVYEQGRVTSVGDGIVWITGLPSAAVDEILALADGSRAMVFHLTENLVGAILLEQTEQLTAGILAFHHNPSLAVPVGDNLLGRVIDPLGEPLDGGQKPQCDAQGLLDILSPPITQRDFVHRPLYTGNKILDNLIPIGKGQRELIIGDNGLGKSALAMDAVINQRGKNVYCVYVLVGQKRSSVINTVQILKELDALAYTTVVVAEATALPGLQYLAPFSGCAIAEYWMKTGHDTLVVYDDLTAHAGCYRELSLLLRRPPGREAYPADIFHLHARLLERSTCLAAEQGGGSMTALPIIETKEGEIATYIPTNLISITDGQIFFDENLFSSGFFPAIDITKSVSRVGGAAQDQSIKNEAGRMKLDYMQFLDLEIFTRFGVKLDAVMQKQITRGKILRELLKQDTLAPLPIQFQLAWLIAYNDGLLDDVKTEEVAAMLGVIEQEVKNTALTLSSTREQWQEAVKSWLTRVSHEQAH